MNQFLDLSTPQQLLNMLKELDEHKFIDIVSAQKEICGHSALNDLAWDVHDQLIEKLRETNDLSSNQFTLLHHVRQLLF